MSIVNIASKADFDALIRENRVVLQAQATWCGPCKAMLPYFEQEAKDHSEDGVTFARFDTDEVGDLAVELGIRSIPAFLAFEGGQRTDSITGANPPALKKMVESIIASK